MKQRYDFPQQRYRPHAMIHVSNLCTWLIGLEMG